MFINSKTARVKPGLKIQNEENDCERRNRPLFTVSVYCNVNVLSYKSYISACSSFTRISVSDEPLVTCPEELVFIVALLKSGLLGIGILGKNYAYAEIRFSLSVAGCIVKGIFVNHNNLSLICNKCLYLGGIELSVYDIIHLGKKKNELGCSDIEFTSAVILEAVELGVAAPAHSDLNGHSAVSTVCEIVVKICACFKAVDAGLISYSLCGKFDLLHCIEKRCYIVSCKNMSVSLELFAVN